MTTPAQDLFVQAKELEPAARGAFLEEACGDDAALRMEVERLLAAAARADSFFGGDDGATLGAQEFQESYAEKEGDVIGPYKLRQAISDRSNNKSVALKKKPNQTPSHTHL